MKLPFADSTGPSPIAVSVTTSDTVDLVNPARYLRANVAGAIKVTMIDGSTPTLNFAAGETRALQVTRVWLTGTTATGIEAMV